MKRYITGLTALIIAIAAVAFTAPKKKGPYATFTFHYTPGAFTQSLVESNGNWSSGASTCTGASNKACQMEVTDTYTHLAGTTRVLNTSGSVIVIKAVLGTAGVDYVPDPGTSTGIPSAVDKK